MIRLPGLLAPLGRCVCSAPVGEDSFRSEASLAEFYYSGLCQECQDRIYFAPDGAGIHDWSVRTGVVVAHGGPDGQIDEVAVLPFVFLAETGRVAWETRFVLRIGRGLLAPVDPVELEPMAEVLGGHLIRLTEVHPLTHPNLGEWLGALDVLIALDASSLEAIAGACPALGGAVTVVLADALPWAYLCGHPLVPFDGFVRALGLDSSPPPEMCVLRRCALLGAVLGLPEALLPGGPTLLRRVLVDAGACHPEPDGG